LQSCGLEFFHGDYKPDNVFVKRLDPSISKIKYFEFNVYGRHIKIPNMGFAVLIADFDRSSITLQSPNDRIKKKYRIISPLIFRFLIGSSVGKTIKKYGNSDPEKEKEIHAKKYGINMFLPKAVNLTLTIYRAAGVRYFRDIDLYTFMIMLLNDNIILDYVRENKIDQTIMSFMTTRFREQLFKTNINKINMNWAGSVALDIFEKIKEPMPRAMTPEYLKSLEILNLYLFEPK
jgi:hypothetical protein